MPSAGSIVTQLGRVPVEKLPAAATPLSEPLAWSTATHQAPLPTVKSVGPCPFVKVLYDAGRWQEFKDKREAAASVQYTGEIQGVRAVCEYKRGDPIRVQIPRSSVLVP